jgi:hypothetical protein
MQSKSPFKKVDIFDGRASSYRNPSTVIQPIVGAIVGNQIAKTASELGTKAITTSMNKDQRAASAAAGDLKHQRDLELVTARYGDKRKGATKTSDIITYDKFRTDQIMKDGIGGIKKGVTPSNGVPDLVKIGRDGKGTHGIKTPKAQSTITVGNTTSTKDGGDNDVFGEDKPNNPYFDSSFRMTGSPVKHNESAVGSIAGAQPQGQSMAGIRAIGQKPTDSAQGGGGVFGAAAQAIGSTGAFGEPLPPPNQVAESGSYTGAGERMLEMDSNPVGNQSIGRDTDVASQLFGSGQRASMLAMKGTPLHIEDQEMDELDN